MAPSKLKFERKKVVLVGDAGVGKTSLIISGNTGHFPLHCVPAWSLALIDIELEDNKKDFDEKKEVSAYVWDTPGSAKYANIRAASYPDTDVFLICFAVDDPYSLENVLTKWSKDIRQSSYCSDMDTPVILVGTKVDLRTTEPIPSKLNLEKNEETDDLVCSICSEYFVYPVDINCGHTYCEMCLDEWLGRRSECPLCRCSVKSATVNRVKEKNVTDVVAKGTASGATGPMEAARALLVADRSKAVLHRVRQLLLHTRSMGPTMRGPGTLVTAEEGAEVAVKIGAVVYLECSAFKMEGVKEVFATAATVAEEEFKRRWPRLKWRRWRRALRDVFVAHRRHFLGKFFNSTRMLFAS